MSTLKLDTREQFDAWLDRYSLTMRPPVGAALAAVPAHDVRALYDALRPRWVSVSERLPEKSEYYLVVVDDCGDVFPWMIEYDCGWNTVSESWKVTDWMENLALPEES